MIFKLPNHVYMISLYVENHSLYVENQNYEYCVIYLIT